MTTRKMKHFAKHFQYFQFSLIDKKIAYKDAHKFTLCTSKQ